MISVCIATYNGEKYIKEQLDSILCQLSEEDEIIISDDNSKDKTIDIIKSYKDDRIKLFPHEKDMSLCKKDHPSFYFATKNFENALSHAKGDYIFLSDQDDIWLPNKVERTLAVLRDNYAMMSNCQIIDDIGNVTLSKFREVKPFADNFIGNLIKMSFVGCCMAFRKEVVEKALPFPKDLFAHDFWLGCIATKYYNIVYLDEVLHSYRQHSNNVSPGSSKSKNSIFFKIKYRLRLLFQYCSLK